jgi:hypothetical protein
MSASLLITTIITYILSLVLSLVLMIFSKGINSGWKKGIIVFHTALLVAYLFSLIFFKANPGIVFLVFFCFGVAIAGMMLRSNLHVLLKIYYSVFLFSIVLFLYSPSLLFSLLGQQKFPAEKKTEFHITGNYYLIKEKSMLAVSNTFVKYKIVKRTGKFNKTLQRNISFYHEIDSVKALKFVPEQEAVLRGYFSSQNETDSADISTELKIKDENEITIQRGK